MKSINLKFSEVTTEAVKVGIVVLMGAILYSAVLGLEKLPLMTALHSSSTPAQTAKLTNKKTCIMVAWQKQSGIATSGIDRQRCAGYLPAEGSSNPMLAKNH